jgi:DSBA-like thioredoxin domain-containing protein
MRLIVYGDFNCPYSYLASQRVDALLPLGCVEVDWRAVEHDARLSMTGTPASGDRETWNRELAEVTALALPAEQPPAAVPLLISNTLAAVSAYTEAVTDGVQHELRRVLFEAIWVRRRHLSNAYDVRPIITSVTYPPYPIGPYLSSELPPPGLGDPDPLHMTRVLGGTIAPNGIPLTTTGWRRGHQWRQEWLALAQHVVPTVIDPTGTALPGVQGLAYLAGLLTPNRPPTAHQPPPADSRSAVCLVEAV